MTHVSVDVTVDTQVKAYTSKLEKCTPLYWLQLVNQDKDTYKLHDKVEILFKDKGALERVIVELAKLLGQWD